MDNHLPHIACEYLPHITLYLYPAHSNPTVFVVTPIGKRLPICSSRRLFLLTGVNDHTSTTRHITKTLPNLAVDNHPRGG